MLWLIPAVCSLAALGCIVAGILPLLRAKHTLDAHTERLQAALPVAVVDGARLRAALARLDATSAAAQAETARIGAAVRRIAESASDLRLREAVLALRLAGAALRTLRSLF